MGANSFLIVRCFEDDAIEGGFELGRDNLHGLAADYVIEASFADDRFFVVTKDKRFGLGTEDPEAVVDIHGDLKIQFFDLTFEDDEDTFHNVSTQNMSALRISGFDTDYTITGFADGADGKLLYLFNNTVHVLTLVASSGDSDDENRITTPSGDDLAAAPGSITQLQYDLNTEKWIVISSAGDSSNAVQKNATSDTTNDRTVNDDVQVAENFLEGQIALGHLDITFGDGDVNHNVDLLDADGKAYPVYKISGLGAAANWTGATPAAVDGQTFLAINTNAYKITIQNNDPSSDVDARFKTPAGLDLILYPGGSVYCRYDESITQWVVLYNQLIAPAKTVQSNLETSAAVPVSNTLADFINAAISISGSDITVTPSVDGDGKTNLSLSIDALGDIADDVGHAIVDDPVIGGQENKIQPQPGNDLSPITVQQGDDQELAQNITSMDNAGNITATLGYTGGMSLGSTAISGGASFSVLGTLGNMITNVEGHASSGDNVGKRGYTVKAFTTNGTLTFLFSISLGTGETVEVEYDISGKGTNSNDNLSEKGTVKYSNVGGTVTENINAGLLAHSTIGGWAVQRSIALTVVNWKVKGGAGKDVSWFGIFKLKRMTS